MVQYSIHRRTNRHFNPMSLCQLGHRRRGRHPFDYRAPTRDYGINAMTASKLQAEDMIARLGCRAAEHQITETRHAPKRFSLRPLRDPEPNDLSKPPGDQRRSRIVAKATPDNDPTSDCHHVLDGAADFHAHWVFR